MNRIGFLVAISLLALLAVVLVLILHSMILRTACWMAGTNVPRFWRSLGTVVVEGVLKGLVLAGIFLALWIVFDFKHLSRSDQHSLLVLGDLFGFLLSVPLSALVYWLLLEQVSFARCLLIWLCEFAIKLIIGFVVTILVVGLVLTRVIQL